MNRFVISTLTVLLATSAAAPQMAQAQEDKAFNMHQRYLTELDQRNKFDIKDPNFNMQRLRLAEMDVRNKADEGKGEFNMHQLYITNRDRRNKATAK